MLIVVRTQRIKHTKGHLSLSCFGYVKFSGFRSSKTSANKRLLLCLWTILVRMEGWHTRPHSPAWIISTAKVMNYFGLSKKRVIFGWFLFRNWWVNFFRNRVNLFRKWDNFIRFSILRKVLFGEAGSWVGVLSVVSRSSLGGIREGIREVKETAILINSTFWWFGVLWSFLGSSLVSRWSFTRSIYTRNKGRES